jgi:mannose-6-phosphate isomerase-like protein (cupin superfamily)
MAVIPASEAQVHELGGVRFTALASPSRGSTETSVWQVEVPVGSGPGTPHELTREEVLVIVAGRADVRLGDSSTEAGPGDTIVVPPHTTFALGNAGDEPLRAIVSFPVGGEARLDGASFVPPWAA